MVLLSFDIEEFDMPLEYKKSIPFEEQIAVSVRGTEILLDLLAKHGVKATFFSTACFAENALRIIDRIIAEGHELASHGYYHSSYDDAHLLSSRRSLQNISNQEIIGYRMARMMPVDDSKVAAAGYVYNTSINPTYIPGRYNNLKSPRTWFKKDGVIQIPASVSPGLRIPLFWLSFHNFPLYFYKSLCHQTYRKDGYLNLYFHPWEFIDLHEKKYGLPGYVSRNSGQKMSERIIDLICWMKTKQYSFGTFKEFLNNRILDDK